MKKQIIIILFLIFFVPSICYSKLHFGIISGVKEKVKELKNKIDEEEKKVIPPNSPSADWVDADGSGQESINISNTNGTYASYLSLCLDGAGNPHIAWHDYTSENYEIYYLKWDGSAWVDADGSGQESINISNNSEGSCYPSLCLDGAGNPHISWYNYTSENNNDIYYLKWNGSAWVDADGSGQESISISNNSLSFKFPSLCLDGTGIPHIAWQYRLFDDIYYLKWDGSVWADADGSGQESINILNNSGHSYHPSLCLDTAGNPHIAWDDDTSGNYEIYYLKWNGSAWVDADGSGWESINISNNNKVSDSPSLYLDGTGNPHIAWHEYTPGVDTGIYYLKWDGSAWVDADGSGQESISILYLSGSSRLSLCLDGTGNPHIAWDGYYGIYYLKWSP